jgi:cell division protein FtsW (lipid II flippase)
MNHTDINTKKNISILSNPYDVSKGLITTGLGFIKYEMPTASGYKSGQIKNSEIKSIHYETNSNMKSRTILWVILGLILSVLVYLSVESVSSKIIGLSVCMTLLISLIIINSLQSAKSHIMICTTSYQVIFPIKIGHLRKKEILDFTNNILLIKSSYPTQVTASPTRSKRIISRGPRTPNT